MKTNFTNLIIIFLFLIIAGKSWGQTWSSSPSLTSWTAVGNNSSFNCSFGNVTRYEVEARVTNLNSTTFTVEFRKMNGGNFDVAGSAVLVDNTECNIAPIPGGGTFNYGANSTGGTFTNAIHGVTPGNSKTFYVRVKPATTNWYITLPITISATAASQHSFVCGTANVVPSQPIQGQTANFSITLQNSGAGNYTGVLKMMLRKSSEVIELASNTGLSAGTSHTFSANSVPLNITAGTWYLLLEEANGTVICNKTVLIMPSEGCWLKVSAGQEHTLAIKNDGTLWGWGSNDYRKITSSSAYEIKVPTQIGTDNDWKDVAAGYDHSVALKNDGTLWTWGYGLSGRLGLGNTNNADVPTKVGTDTNWTKISAGYRHTAALKTNGTLWLWGNNTVGQLGDGTYVSKNVPTQLGTDSNWKDISIGWDYSLAVKTNGGLYGWGINQSCELGIGACNSGYNTPMLTNSALDWSSVDAGYRHSMAIKNNGTLWGWGDNVSGGLGLGDTTRRTFPHVVDNGAVFTDVSVGVGYTIGIKSNGSLWTWGYNVDGQLGNGTNGQNTNAVFPTQISASGWTKASAGHYFGTALKSNGELWSWGKNSRYELGDNTTVNKNYPIKVTCLAPLSVNEISQESSVIIYPNPFVNHLFIKTKDQKIKQITILDLGGKLVKKLNVNNISYYQIEAGKLVPGVYIVSVQTDKGTESFKVIKK